MTKKEKQTRDRIDKIDEEIQNLIQEKNELLLELPTKTILERLANLVQLDWEEDSYIHDPFQDQFLKQFIKESNLDKNPIIDDYCILSMDFERHESTDIYHIAEHIVKSAKGDYSAKVQVLYDRMSRKFYLVTVQEALEALERYVIKNKVHSWKIDW